MNPRPRILLLGDYLSQRVAARTPGEDLAAHLRDAGNQVSVRSTKPTSVGRLLDKWSGLLRLRDRYDIVHIDVFGGRAFHSAEILSRSANLLGKPVVLTLHGGLLPELARRDPQRVRRVLLRAGAVTAPSAFLHRALATAETPIQIVPNPVDRGVFAYTRRDGVGPGILWLRAFHRTYDPVTAAAAFLRYAEIDREARFTLCGRDKGDGSLQETERLVRASAHHERFHFLPRGVPHHEVPALLAQNDIFVNSSIVDNSPVSILEALSCGLCVVSTSAGGIADLIEHERDALLVPPADPFALCAALRRVRQETGLARRLAGQAQATVERHSWEAILPIWQDLYERVCSRSPQPGAPG